MDPRNAASAAVDANALPHDNSADAAGGGYECMLCGTRWGYADIHNTARCPACGGGLVRDPADPIPR